MNRKTGFTLLEMVVVLAIISLMAGLALPSLINFYREEQSRQTMSQLVRVLRFAHQESIFKRKTRIVALDFDTNTYSIFDEPREDDYSNEPIKRHQTPLPESFQFKSIYYPKEERQEDSDLALVHFYPNGTADQIELEIRRYNDKGIANKVYIVRVNGMTGHIKVKQKEDDDESYF